MRSLRNKNIVITGASSGIGEQVAVKVAQLGARAILIARSEEKLTKIAEQINQQASVNCLYYPLDVSDIEQVKLVFNQILHDVGSIDILLNNAGFGIFESFAEASLEDMQNMFNVNVLGVMACTKAVLPEMLKQHSGHIINIASQAGKLATPKSSGYAASKHAVLGFTNSLRMELKDNGIAVSAVNPGPIATNFFDQADRSGNYVKRVKRFMLHSERVADRIIQLMIRPKRELNLPWWMNLGSVLYLLFPRIADKLVGGILDKK
ncbi:oxidoreductase [Oceanobacillus arenosus]|uniref:Oxidoreductase n=1 Tax=Oceanobacillus arenosus TaxID=1229153 RepID=A0A3D8PNX2_9BACI|nr:SDR family oxidoreductase [Oceanobacillus arenosus]RDW17352.1 oxidoreductase [Oceanobacillus arenosus]